MKKINASRNSFKEDEQKLFTQLKQLAMSLLLNLAKLTSIITEFTLIKFDFG